MELQVLEPEVKTPKFTDEPLISFIVPAHANNLDPSILKRCLMSLEDQDYPNMEVIIVINGGTDSELEKTAQFFCNKDKKFQMFVIPEGGACNARNIGFEFSKGEIISFFNSDYRAKPGMVSMWVEKMVENPEYGFAYGGYEYATAPAVPYWSKPFDKFQLEVANYIDCGFPIWRKYVVKWDSDVKSLQDWDFWLRVVKTYNVEGLFIDRDLSFIAEPPRPKGLSADSSQNWIDRVKFVKEKNGIALRDIVVTSLGASNHAIEIAKMIGADYRDDTIYKPNEYKALYMIGFYMKPNDKGNQHPQILGSFPPNVKKIIHFVGADIYWLRKFPYESLKIISGVIKMGSDHILCENEQAQKELREFGIESKIVPIPPYNDYEIKPFPEKYTVALYLTAKSDFDKYFMKHTLSIVRAMPDVQFTGYGDGATDFDSPNFKHYGVMAKEKYKEYVYANSAILRLVRHDTLPMAGCDFFLAGRDVITNIPMPYAHMIDTKGELPMDSWDIFSPGFSALRWPDTKKKIVQEIRASKRGRMEMRKEFLLKKEARDFYSKILNREKYLKTINELAGIKGE